MNKYLTLLTVLATFVLTACTSTSIPVWKEAIAGDGPGDITQVQQNSVEVRNLPKSRSGNRAVYEVFGIRYSVLDNAYGFRETGTASWYGSKFHGNATASGEIYDMHRLTAAHKHLPLPTFVRVTRVDSGLSVVVKVNDRGPFVGDRIIDLSYGAAVALDMLDRGKAKVLVEALSHHEEANVSLQFVQVGAFSDAANAKNLKQRISSAVQVPVQLDFESALQVYRVKVGPLPDAGAVDSTLRLLASQGIVGYPVTKPLP